jgi:hypothetical protein
MDEAKPASEETLLDSHAEEQAEWLLELLCNKRQLEKLQ